MAPGILGGGKVEGVYLSILMKKESPTSLIKEYLQVV